MSQKLKYVITIPSVDVPGYVAIKDLILLGSGDKRYQDLKEQSPILKQYLDSFKTPLGNKINPSVVVQDEDLSQVDASHLCAFRNAIAIAAVIGSLKDSYLYGRPMGYYCTDLFDFHPVSISRDEKDLVARTPFEMCFGSKVSDFIGQTTWSVIYPNKIDPIYDKEFMTALLDVVEEQTHTRKKQLFKNRVVRSMEMAYCALKSPFANLGRSVDFGILTVLWVSAYEILANPHVADVKFSDVSVMIKSVPWREKKLRIKNRMAVGAVKRKKTTLPVQIYGRLYKTRNDYIHGNVIHKATYESCSRKGWGSLFFQAPALYRCALMHILNKEGFGGSIENSQEHEYYEKVLLKK